MTAAFKGWTWDGRDPGLYWKLRYLIGFRSFFVLVMAASAFSLQWAYNDPVTPAFLWMALASISFSISSWGLTKWKALIESPGLNLLALSQVAWDLGFTTILLYQTGGIFSAFPLLYGVYIVLSAVTFGSSGAVWSSIASMICYFSIGISQNGISELFSQASEIARATFTSSMLLLLGGFVAQVFRGRDQLARNLERTTADLNELNSVYQAIVNHVSAGILSCDASGRVLFQNHASHRILEKSWTNESLQSTMLEPFLSATGRQEIELIISGIRKRIGYSNTILPDGSMVIVFQDVSEIHQMTERLRLKEKLAAVGQLAAGVAHEIRNPLASLSGSIQLLKTELDLNPENEKLMNIVIRETDRLDLIAKSFLDYARPSQLYLSRERLMPVVEEVIQLVQNAPEFVEKKLKIRTSLAGDLACLCDTKQLKQVLWNLVMNAVQAVPVEGEISILAQTTNRENQDWVSFLVRDSGPGIPEDLKSKIFEPFFTTKISGTGLGLALVYQILKAHGGRVGVESQVGTGTTFWFEIPLAGPNQAKVDEKDIRTKSNAA